MDSIDFSRLGEPFDPADIEWRVGSRTKDKSKGIALAYITARAAMARLDEVCGPENWRDEYREWRDNSQLCGLYIRINGEWVGKWDGGADTEVQDGGALDFDTNVKGGLSASFKRACVKWGIGRYLYQLENTWIPLENEGRRLSYIPELPKWATPNGALLAKIAAEITSKAMVDTAKAEYRARCKDADVAGLRAILAEVSKR